MAKKQTIKEKIDRAIRYPYARPPASFLFESGEKTFTLSYIKDNADTRIIPSIDLEHDQIGTALPSYDVEIELDNEKRIFKNRIPVVVIGSNADVKRLEQKFADYEGLCTIPVLQATMKDFAITPAAHVTSYGSLPATIEEKDGEELSIFVTFLSPPQLVHMNKSEALGVNYLLRHLPVGKTKLENGQEIDAPLAYQALSGSFRPKGKFTPLTDTNQSELQQALLSLLKKQFGNGRLQLDTMILKHIDDPRFREKSRKIMRKHRVVDLPDPQYVVTGLPADKATQKKPVPRKNTPK